MCETTKAFRVCSLRGSLHAFDFTPPATRYVAVSLRTISELNRFSSHLKSSVDSDSVVWLRIVFGVVSAWWVFKQFTTGAIDAFYVMPQYHFHYWGFEWVTPFSESVTSLEFAVLGIAALMTAAGAFYRLAAIVFAVGFSHLFLVDKCLYQNHFYLIVLLSWLLVFIPANRALSVDSMIWPTLRSKYIPRWSVWLLRFQFALPYFFGGIAKLNSDWLGGEPMYSMLKQRTELPVVGAWLTEPWCVAAFIYGGLLFDLLFVPAVLTNRFRGIACCFAIAFHCINAQLFTIGVFPWLMLLSLPIFLQPGTLRRLVLRQPIEAVDDATEAINPPTRWSAMAWLGVFFVILQITLPLRHFALPGVTSWTEEGHCFSWRMLVRGKQPALRLIATDPKTGKSGAVDLRPFVTEYQLHRVAREPRLIHQLTNNVALDLRKRGYDDVEIRALALVSLNGRKPQLMIDPRVNLANEKIGFDQIDWIVPLTEPLRAEPWDVPMSEWERMITIPKEYRN